MGDFLYFQNNAIENIKSLSWAHMHTFHKMEWKWIKEYVLASLENNLVQPMLDTSDYSQ